MSLLYAVDPGTLQSALVVCRRGGPFGLDVVSARMLLNGPLLAELARVTQPADLVIEQIASFGMAVGAEVFETVFWTGRFFEAWPGASTRHRLPRSAVKMHLCQTMRAKDSNIRQALIDRFGGASAIGKKAAPGPLYGVRSHCLAALAVAVTWNDQHAQASTSQGFGPLSAGSDALLR
jgi:hypothetical protein